MAHVETAPRTETTITQRVGLILGPVLFFAMVLFGDLVPGRPEVTRMAAIALLMATWWITEAIPLFATALVPIVLYPLFGLLSTREIAPVYLNSTIFLFLGGFMIAIALETWNLHKRIALIVIRFVGGTPQRILLGFMIASAFLSMWISNTATAIMMVPIGLSIIYQMEDRFGPEQTRRFAVGLMLGIAYACSVGGVATLVGTPPNLSFARIFEITFPGAEPIAFGTWFLMGLPLSIIMTATIWLLLTKVLFRLPDDVAVDPKIVRDEYRALGPISYEERVVSVVFVATAVLWVFRRDLDLGIFTIPGWSDLLPFPTLIDDGTIAVAMALSLFFVATRSADAPTRTLLAGAAVRKLPWGIVLLFGGGFALAKGIQSTGLSEYIGDKFTGLEGVSPLLMILAITLVITFLTELTSNTATTEMVLPILAAVAVAVKVNPLMLMIPATLAASHAFMMPVATPPNAIVFGSERVTGPDMARAGVIINFVGILIVTLVFYTIGIAVFDIDPGVVPDWAVTAVTEAP